MGSSNVLIQNLGCSKWCWHTITPEKGVVSGTMVYDYLGKTVSKKGDSDSPNGQGE